MARHLDFRNDVDIAFGSISHDLTDVILSIESTISLWILRICERISETFPLMVSLAYTPCNMVGEVRISIYLKSPSCSICKVKMHHIHLQNSKCIDLLLHELLTLEAARLVKHDSSMLETWIIKDCTMLHCCSRIEKAKHLKGLSASESTFFCQGIYLHTLLAHNKFISLFLSKLRQSLNFGSECSIIHIHLHIRSVRLQCIHSLACREFHRLRNKLIWSRIC